MADNSTTAPEAATITGRDGYIAAKALAYAIARIQSLPERWQEYSDMLDMCAILHSLNCPQSLLGAIVNDVERHVQHKVNLYPTKGMGNECQVAA